ncbi:ABC transporter substrate-binding protein [Oscillibacter sp. MSJ-2]|uniref:ABC transporter substrate-binding protein n=1 Tax=Dysosmobacter acutus TaxID=2841504 RepID=A0ABS6F729_9FIRM|nr:ABC transporter substrate-binding protein [Dysosmobacter acutus]MBU5625481.1 ABC transporter substrate-binding protein [Dysosmobacter acutus]
MKHKTPLVSLFLAILMIFSLTACGGNQQSGGGSETRDSVNFGLTGEPSSLDPHLLTDQMSYAVWYQLYDTLIARNQDGELVPAIAENWEWNEDNTVLTLNLRKDVKFHDGSMLTADDVVFTIERIHNSKRIGSMLISFDRVEKADDYTVKLYYTAPYAGALNSLASSSFSIVPKAIVEKDEEGFANAPVGCGPYKFVSRSSGEKIVLEAFDDYYRGAPSIRHLTFKIMTDGVSAAIALQKGELDILSHAPLTERQNLIDDPNIEWYETEIAGLMYLLYNTADPVFSNAKLREAISYAIDKNAMILGACEGLGTPLEGWLPPSVTGYDPNYKNGHELDLEKAKQLMVEAGYPDGLTITVLSQEMDMYYKPTEILQNQLSKIGITIEIQKMERAAWIQEIGKKAYGMTIMHWTVPVGDGDVLYELYHGDSIQSGQNYVGCDDADLNALLEQARVEVDAQKRVLLYNQAQQIIIDRGYSFPLYTFMAGAAANKDLKGFQADAIYRFHVYDYSWA